MKKINGIKNKILIIIGGIAIGICNGFFGGGGGMVSVPIVEKLLKVDNKKSHATTLLIMLPLSIVSAAIYILRVEVDWLMFSFISAGFIAGGILGALLLKKLSGKIVRIIFAVVVLAAGIRMVI